MFKSEWFEKSIQLGNFDEPKKVRKGNVYKVAFKVNGRGKVFDNINDAIREGIKLKNKGFSDYHIYRYNPNKKGKNKWEQNF